ncbi:MAG: hypothetical protein ACXAEU_18975 [Candidatus Hodarchaeales archaeon]
MKRNVSRLLILISCLILSNCLITNVYASSDIRTDELSPGTVVNSNNWNNSDYLKTGAGNWANSSVQANYIILGDFGLQNNISGGQINGIEVILLAKIDSGYGTMVLTYNLSWDGGTSWTAGKESPGITSTTGDWKWSGGNTDKWGRPTWALSDFDDGNFLMNVSSKNNDGTEYCHIGSIRVIVYGSGFLPEFNNLFFVPLFALVAVLPLFLLRIRKK